MASLFFHRSGATARHRNAGRLALAVGLVLGALGLVTQVFLPGAAAQSRGLRRASGMSRNAGSSATAVPLAQTFGAAQYGVNPTSVASDVNSLDGALEVGHTDMHVAGIGVPFALDRHYNSRDVGLSGAFGPGWSSILDLAVRFSSHGRRATVYGEDGQQVGFTYSAAARGWLRDPGVRASLSCSGPVHGSVPPATCTVTRFSDGVNWTLSHGRVENYHTATGQGLTFGYTSGRISSVTVESTASKPLVVRFTRDRAGRVTKLTTPTRSVVYTYDAAGDLSAVTDANRNVWRMTYASGHRLTAMTAYSTPNTTSGIRVLSASYDAHTGRASATVERLGSQMHNTTFGWSGTGESGQAYRYELEAVNGGSLVRVRYTDSYSNGVLTKKQQPLGQTETFQYGGDLDLLRTTTPTGSTDTMTYDNSGDELSTAIKLDNSGTTASETFTYDSHHRLLSSSQPVTSDVTDTTTYAYDSRGELASTTTAGSGTTSYVYNSHALPISETDGAGNVTSYTYDAYGNVTGESVRDPSGAEPDGPGPLYAFNESGEQVLSVPASANQGGGNYVAADATRTAYTPDGQETSVTTPGPATSTTSYDAAGNVTSSSDPNGRTTTHTWSPVTVKGGQDWEEQITDPAGSKTNIYDPSGDVLSSTPPQPGRSVSGKPVGVVTDVYNADQQVTSNTNGQGVTTSYTRDGLGDVVKSTSRGVTTTATYNLVGWATSASTTTLSYPPDNGTPGNPQSKTSTTYTVYGLAGQVLQSVDAAGGTITYTYGAGDHIASVKDQHGITSYAYDPLGDVTSVTSPSGDVTTYTYNAQGHETSQTIGSQTWTMAYNANGNLVQTVDPDGRTATYTYDAMNRKTGVTYSWGNGASGATAPAVTWSYDKLGERTQMTDGVGTHTYTYDSQGRLLTADTVSPSGSQNFSYDYSTPGEISETYPDHTAVTYHTDDGGNLLGISVPAQSDGSPAFKTGNMLPTTGVTQGATQIAAAAATAATGGTTPEAPSGTLYPDGLLAYTFTQPQTNSQGAATMASGTAFYTASMANSANSSNPDPPQGAYIAEADYNGNLLSERWLTVPANGQTQGNEMTLDYGYNGGAVETPVLEGSDAGVQLTGWSSTYNTPTSQSQQSGSYTYDTDGNPTVITNNGLSGNWHWNFGYNDAGEIASVTTNAPNPNNTGQAPAFSYDRAGDMTQAGGIPSPGMATSSGSAIQGRQFGGFTFRSSTQWTFSYNDAGQLASASEDGTTRTVTFSYDGDGNLVSESDPNPSSAGSGIPAQTVSLIWDPRPASPQLAEADINSTHERYFWGNGLVGMETGGAAYTIHDNQNGTPTMVTDTSGETVQESYYDPDGNFINSSSQLPGLGQLLIGFDGAYRDPVVGVDMVGGRWYDPVLGMFMSRSSPTPPTPGSSAVASQPSTATSGMSASPGTSPLVPVPAPASDYGIGGQDPTNQTQMGSSVVPASLGSQFKGLGQGVVSFFDTISPYAFGTASNAAQEAPSALKALYKSLGELTSTETPNAAAEAGAASEVANSGSTVAEEATTLANEANNVEEEASTLGTLWSKASGAAKVISKYLGPIMTVGGMAISVYETVETCGQYGSSSRECIGSALGTAISWTTQLACDALTAGAGSVPCGLLQSVLSTIIPLVIEGNGQAFLDSVTFGSGFNIADANVLAGQLLIAAALGPLGATALLGEVIYANWGPISNFFSTYGTELISSLVTTGETIANGLEGVGTATLSGISTAGTYLASGVGQLANYLINDGFPALANEFKNLGGAIGDVVDQIGSSLCDFASDVSCFFSSTFGFAARPSGRSRKASGAGLAAGPPPVTRRSSPSLTRRGAHRLRTVPQRSNSGVVGASRVRRRPGHSPRLRQVTPSPLGRGAVRHRAVSQGVL